MRIKVRCKPRTKAFYDGILRYGSGWGEPGDGVPFFIEEDAFRYNEDGKILVTKDMKPVLPRWAEVIGEVPVIPEDKAVVVTLPEKRKNPKHNFNKPRHDFFAPAKMAGDEDLDAPEDASAVNVPEQIKRRARKSDQKVLE